MPATDARGLPLSTASAQAAAQYREGVDLLLAAWPGADAALDGAIAADPGFALAHAARARLHAIRAEPAAARARIAAAQAAVAKVGTERERSHVAALALAIAGRGAEALAAVEAHLESWPRDALVFSLPLGAFGLLAFSGRADHDQARVALCERHAAAFAADDWWFLTYRGWSHAENGAVAHGRALAERGLALRPANANAAHAVAHAMHEGGDGAAAAALLAAWLPTYDRAGTLHGHIAWHAALVALEAGDAPGALALYEAHVRPAASLGMPVNVVSDGASFLWRLGAYGHPVPAALWRDVAAHAAPVFPQAGFPFADLHMALLEAATGEDAALERRAAALEASALPAGPATAAACRAALAFAQGDDARCARLLAPVAGEVVRIGGSGAQREILEDMRLVALMRAGEAAQARALLDARLHRRPSPRDAAWRAALAA